MIRVTDIRRLLIAALASVLLSVAGWAQDAETDAADAVETDETTAEPGEATASQEADEEDIVVDDGSYLDAEDDDFRPSEEISADRSITFPTDI